MTTIGLILVGICFVLFVYSLLRIGSGSDEQTKHHGFWK